MNLNNQFESFLFFFLLALSPEHFFAKNPKGHLQPISHNYSHDRHENKRHKSNNFSNDSRNDFKEPALVKFYVNHEQGKENDSMLENSQQQIDGPVIMAPDGKIIKLGKHLTGNSKLY